MTEHPAPSGSVNTLTVIVAGAGIGGLAVALLLSRAGAKVTLVERVTDPAEVGAGLLLQPNGLAVLKGLGLDDAVLSSGSATRGGAIRSADGRVISRIATPDYGPGLDRVVALRRGLLYSVLLTAVREDPDISCHFGTTVIGATRTGEISVRTSTDEGRLTADVVVGADGVNSTIRTAGDFRVTTAPTGHRYLRAIVPTADAAALHSPTLAGEFWTALGLFGGGMIDNFHQYFYADVTSGPVANAEQNRDLPALASIWAQELPLAGELLRRVATFDDLLINDVTTVTCQRWFDERLVLIGDAAHSMPPTAGQGANSALVDAAILAFYLWQDPLDKALKAYDHRRRQPVRRVQRRAEQLAKLAGIRNPAAQSLRDSIFRLLNAIPGTGRRIADSLQQEDPSTLLRIVRDTSGGGPRH